MSKRVLIGMSGGIDSTVAAILLQEQGYELVGATFRTFDVVQDANLANTKGCCSEDSITEAQKMAQLLGIEHHVLDFRETFRQYVISNFVDEYAHGRTPNPCVMCNSHIKWGKLLEAADAYGCDYVATGHYAQIAEHRGHLYLKNAVDSIKDQTYFLWMLTEENLRRTIFPLGGLTKTQVRQIAFEHGYVELSKKAESQDICFIPNNDYRTFLSQQGLHVEPGNYIDSEGKVLGSHCGFCNYTIGQRKGLGIALGHPAHVLRINAEKNTVMLGTADDLKTEYMLLEDAMIINQQELLECSNLTVRIRYRSKPIPCQVLPLDNGQMLIHFLEEASAITPGQSAVFYDGKRVLGGAFIASQRGINMYI